MSDLATRYQIPRDPGLHELPADLEHLSFALARVPDGDSVELDTGADEALVVTLEAGPGAVVHAGEERFELPPRTSVFTEEPSAVFAPPGTRLKLDGPLLAGIFRSPATDEAGGIGAYLIGPDEVETVERGSGNFHRRVRDILPAGRPATRLLAGETLNPPGNWSSSPPHKHDRHAPPEEVELEEIYLFRVDPDQGFGVQIGYSNDPPGEQATMVRDLDATAIPSGYHPVVAGPGYGLYYLWCLAGRGRELHWYTDPAHAWVDAS
jgi:5-deoxy-glucuronate isomerase